MGSERRYTNRVKAKRICENAEETGRKRSENRSRNKTLCAAHPLNKLGISHSRRIIDKTLEIFGAGTKIAIEAAVIATDAGEVDAGEEIVSCAGTYKGLDTALVVKTTYSGGFFKEFEVREIIAKPICRVKALPEYKYENWKGNLDQYYL
jgi:hypothetical protein